MTPAPQPQGIDAILAALQSGGQPNGNIANLPPPVNAQTGITALDPAAQAASVGSSTGPIPPGLPQMGATDPLAGGGMADLNPAMVQAIVEALMRSGAFNTQQGIPTGQ